MFFARSLTAARVVFWFEKSLNLFKGSLPSEEKNDRAAWADKMGEAFAEDSMEFGAGRVFETDLHREHATEVRLAAPLWAESPPPPPIFTLPRPQQRAAAHLWPSSSLFLLLLLLFSFWRLPPPSFPLSAVTDAGWFPYPPTPSPILFITHQLIHSPSLAQSLDRSLNHPLTQTLTHQPTRSLTHSLAHSLTHSGRRPRGCRCRVGRGLQGSRHAILFTRNSHLQAPSRSPWHRFLFLQTCSTHPPVRPPCVHV